MQDEVKVSQADIDAAQSIIDTWFNRSVIEITLARHRAQAERGEAWRPIETAPRNGDWFLALEPASQCNAHYACKFYYRDEYAGDLWLSSCGQYVTDSPEPTHWMPLPPAPEAGQ